MSGELAIPSALSLLRKHLEEGAYPEDLLLPLRALQMRGLSKLDLTVHIERIRASRAAVDPDEAFDARCLAALDIVHGVVRDSLIWDAAHAAASLLPRCLSIEALSEALPFALEPSDLLPPRSHVPNERSDIRSALVTAVNSLVDGFDMRPEPAELVRAPRRAFTTRPASLLTFPDRLVLEALTTLVETALQSQLPASVIWPRRRTAAVSASYTDRVQEWDSDYVVKADISHFYESVEHSLLGVFLSSHLSLSSVISRAVEAILGATMQLPRGLPQGPVASDVLASAYLLPIDRKLEESDRQYLRYADDYYFPATDVGDGRQTLQQLEAWLNELGLSLNAAKTSVMRMATFVEGLERRAVRELKRRLIDAELSILDEAEDSIDATNVLLSAGVPDQTMWDLMYHGTMSLDDVVEQLVSGDTEDLAKAYELFFRKAADELRSGHDQETITAVASLAFECLVLLAGTDVELDGQDLEEVQTWFPHLTPQIVDYLTEHGHAEWELSANYFRSRLGEPSGVDWVDAWMCHGASRLPPASFPDELLRSLATGSAAEPLTTAEAVRALAIHGALEEADWRDAFVRVGPAVAAEMLFAGLSMTERAPWLRSETERTGSPGIAALLQAFPPIE